MNVDSAINYHYHNGYINLIENIKSDSVKINSFSHILVVILSFVKKDRAIMMLYLRGYDKKIYKGGT